MLQDAVGFVKAHLDRPWLVAGKGPSLDRLHTLNFVGHNIITLNHACRVFPNALIAHFCDLEAFDEVSTELCRGNSLVCLPWHPHEKMKPLEAPLLEAAKLRGGQPTPRQANLLWLLAKNRLLSYNSSTAGRLAKNEKLTSIRVKYFSAEAAFGILARAGAGTICSLGVDGGKGYAEGFAPHNLLANGRESFDIQLPEIRKTCIKHGATWVRL